MGEALAFARGERDDLKVHYYFQNEMVVQKDGPSVVFTLKTSVEDPLAFLKSLAHEVSKSLSGSVLCGEVDKEQRLYHIAVYDASQTQTDALLEFMQARPEVRDASFPKFLAEKVSE